MYIPIWLIVLGLIIYFIYRRRNNTVVFSRSHNSVEDIEGMVQFQKQRIFELEHFDSPHFIDKQDAFDAMEINYLKLKQRFSHTPDKVLEIAKDWLNYADALRRLKNARVMLDVDWGDDAFDNFEDDSKEPSIIKDEVEQKFKGLLGKDFQKVPPDYFERIELAKKGDKTFLSDDEEAGLYGNSANYYKNKSKRQKYNEEREKKKFEEKDE